MPLGSVLYESGNVLRHILSIVSLLHILADRASAQIASWPGGHNRCRAIHGRRLEIRVITGATEATPTSWS